MAVTYSSTVLSARKSILSNALLSAASTAAETLTLVHGLGVSPHDIYPVIRSVVSSPSGAPILSVSSWNASVATLIFNAEPILGVNSVTVDIVCTFEHSIVQ